MKLLEKREVRVEDFQYIVQRLQQILSYRATLSGMRSDVIGIHTQHRLYRECKLIQAYLERMTRMYTQALPERGKMPNSYLAGTYKPSDSFSKRVYRGAVFEVLAFKMIKQLNKKAGY